MKLSITLSDLGPFKEAAKLVVGLEKAGLDMVWLPEAYTFDSISQVGYLAAITKHVEIGTGIVNVYSRTPALMAMTAAGADYLTDGRFHLGMGASGPQVIEGFHGVPFKRPLARLVDYTNACRMIWRREPFEYHGETIDAPLAEGEGTGLGMALKLINHPVRPNIPIWWASLMSKSVEATAQYADGWLPLFVDPSQLHALWGAELEAGLAKRSPDLAPLQIVAGGLVAIGDQFAGRGGDGPLDATRRNAALYIGGMGTRNGNYYNTIAKQYGYAAEAQKIQDLYLAGRKSDAARAVPRGLLESIHLVGSQSYVAERLEAYRAAGVTVLSVTPYGPDPIRTIETLREMLA